MPRQASTSKGANYAPWPPLPTQPSSANANLNQQEPRDQSQRARAKSPLEPRARAKMPKPGAVSRCVNAQASHIRGHPIFKGGHRTFKCSTAVATSRGRVVLPKQRPAHRDYFLQNAARDAMRRRRTNQRVHGRGMCNDQGWGIIPPCPIFMDVGYRR